MLTKTLIYLAIAVYQLSLVYCQSEEESKSSLTFVIDDTFSMHDDIEQVKQQVNDIFDTVYNSNSSQIEDFILVTFNDPDIQFRTKTREKNIFKNELASISVHGGGDCPEMAMKGIERALHESRYGSYLYVFTDATTKESEKLEQINNIAQKKQCQINFILTTSDCRGGTFASDDLYYHHIAEATNGLVFDLENKGDELKEILKTVTEAVKGRNTVISTSTFPSGSHKLNLTVDSKMKELVISVTGKHPKIDVYDPFGEMVSTEDIANTVNAKVVKVTEVKPGVYTAEVTSKSNTRVMVTGATSVHFKHGFAGFRPTSFADTTTRPIPGEKAFLALKLTSEDINIELISAQILDMDGKVISEMPLEIVDHDDQLYVTKDFIAPSTTFQIGMKAVDLETGTAITRISLTPIEPQVIKEPYKTPTKPPKVTISGDASIDVDYAEPLQLKCKVYAYPKPSIIWEDDSGRLTNYTVLVVELPFDYISVLDIAKVDKNNTYSCKATNDHGEDVQKVEVRTKRNVYFDVLETPKDAVIEYGKEKSFVCRVDASPPAFIKWYRNDKIIRSGGDIEISPDQSTLTIRRMQPRLTGRYVCKIKNTHRRRKTMFKVSIAGVQPPAIEKETYEIRANKGSDVNITCKVIRGKPKPKIRWLYQYSSTELTEIEGGETIIIKNVKPEDAGIYRCEAVNVAGEDYHYTELIYEYPPHIKQTRKIMRVSDGQKIKLPCEVHGEPQPVVTWYANGAKMHTTKKFHIHSKYLSFIASVHDNGTYTCEAENDHGAASNSIRVEISVPVTIEVPEDTSINVNVGDSVTLSCVADGYPRPNIMWKFYSPDTKAPPKVLKPHTAMGSLIFERIQVNEHGNYTCIASNAGGSSSITYEVKINSPPFIVNTLPVKEYEGVSGDFALQVPCQAIGYPTPEIIWSKSGLNIASGSTWYDIEKDGTLTIKNIDSDSAGDYICTAQNKLGTDKHTFEIKVLDSPNPASDTSSRNVEEGKSASIACPVPHQKTDLLRWFKDGKEISRGELTLMDIKSSDSGVYICRVSTFLKSTSWNVEVTVGFKPRFLSKPDKLIQFEEGITAVLDCTAEGIPTPAISWWHNGLQISEKTMTHIFVMKVQDRGQFFCLLKNNFGSAVRSFEISSKECLLNVEADFKGNQPLMLTSDLKLPSFDNIDGYMRLFSGDKVMLQCPKGFQNFEGTELLASCDQETNFEHDGISYKYPDYKCKEEHEPIIKETGHPCAPGKNSETVKIGYEIRGEFLDVYEVCLDKDNNIPLYTKQNLHRSLADSVLNRTKKWFDTHLNPFDYDTMYDCDQQLERISLVLRKWFHSSDNCCFSRRQLVNPRDVPPGLSQIATYSHLNVVPQWSTCGAVNWDILERRVRQLAKTTDHNLLVWTGASKQLQLKGASSMQDIFIGDDTVQHPVPKYLWKVVQDPTKKESLAIIQLNIPDMELKKAYNHVLCRDICNDVEWMRSRSWRRVERGYTFCCSITDFEKAFGYKGLFDRGEGKVL